MSSGFDSPNPYTVPPTSNLTTPSPSSGNIKVILPGAMLITVGTLGLLLSLYSAYLAIFVEPPELPPDTPPALRAFQEGAHGPVAAVIQCIFIGVNIAIIAGGLMFVKAKSWVFALVACILACINFGNFCCVLGLPVGIIGIIMLSDADVKATFDANRRFQ